MPDCDPSHLDPDAQIIKKRDLKTSMKKRTYACPKWPNCRKIAKPGLQGLISCAPKCPCVAGWFPKVVEATGMANNTPWLPKMTSPRITKNVTWTQRADASEPSQNSADKLRKAHQNNNKPWQRGWWHGRGLSAYVCCSGQSVIEKWHTYLPKLGYCQ